MDTLYHPDAEEALSVEAPLFEWPRVRWNKVLTLYTLARSVKDGAIVELGTHHGCGTIALALGSRDGSSVPVHTVDPFVDYVGWIGDRYGPDDLEIFEANLHSLGLDATLHREPSEKLCKRWREPISLLYWDIGGKRLVDDYMDWQSRVVPGGTIAIKDLTTWRFGFGYVKDHALENGYVLGPQFPKGCIWTLIKN